MENEFLKEAWQAINETHWRNLGTLEENMKRNAYPEKPADTYATILKRDLDFAIKAKTIRDPLSHRDMIAPIIAKYQERHEAAKNGYSERVNELADSKELMDIKAEIKALEEQKAETLESMDKSQSGYNMDALALDYYVKTKKEELYKQGKSITATLAADTKANKFWQEINQTKAVIDLLSKVRG